jgi:hypothetical protein
VSLAELAARLNVAAEAGVPVTIRYTLGSRATTHRILPVAATATVLRARDVDADRMRVLLLQHVELVAAPARPGEPATAAPPRKAAAPEDHERLASLVETLWNLGWHVRQSTDGIAVYALRADGTPMRVATVSISRNKPGPAQTRRLRRPWTVVSPGLPRARPFGAFDLAMRVFLREATLHAPGFRRGRPTHQA